MLGGPALHALTSSSLPTPTNRPREFSSRSVSAGPTPDQFSPLGPRCINQGPQGRTNDHQHFPPAHMASVRKQIRPGPIPSQPPVGRWSEMTKKHFCPPGHLLHRQYPPLGPLPHEWRLGLGVSIPLIGSQRVASPNSHPRGNSPGVLEVPPPQPDSKYWPGAPDMSLSWRFLLRLRFLV